MLIVQLTPYRAPCLVLGTKRDKSEPSLWCHGDYNLLRRQIDTDYMWSHIGEECYGVKEDLEINKYDGGLSNLGLEKVLLRKRPLRWQK